MNGFQITILISLIIGLLINLNNVIEGKPAVKPSGFLGVLIVLIVYTFLFFIYLKAGLFGA